VTQETRKPSNLLTTSQLRKKIPVAHGTLYAWMDKNSPYFNPRFPRGFKLGGRSVFWLEEDIDRFIEEYARPRGASAIG
jgi:predicted DNA-binding transcriptional regulator AlpA